MFSDFFRWLGERRDGFIVIGAIVYGAGYLVWSYTAWRNGLGQLPALEFQYIIAGILPTLILCAGLAFGHWFVPAQIKINTFLGQTKGWITNSVLAVLVLYTLYLFYDTAVVVKWIDGPTFGIESSSLQKIFIMGWVIISITEHKVAPGMAGFIHRYNLAVFLALSAFNLYMIHYEKLPQVLGGPAPRCAYIDLVRKDISDASLLVLTRNTAKAEPVRADVVRSDRLWVYFSGSEYLLIRLATEAEETNTLKDAPLYELRKEVIRVVEWCA